MTFENSESGFMVIYEKELGSISFTKVEVHDDVNKIIEGLKLTDELGCVVTGDMVVEGVRFSNRSLSNIRDLELDGDVTLNKGIIFTDDTELKLPTNKDLFINTTGNSKVRIAGYDILFDASNTSDLLFLNLSKFGSYPKSLIKLNSKNT